MLAAASSTVEVLLKYFVVLTSQSVLIGRLYIQYIVSLSAVDMCVAINYSCLAFRANTSFTMRCELDSSCLLFCLFVFSPQESRGPLFQGSLPHARLLGAGATEGTFL